MSGPLLQTLEALRGDVAAMRTDICSGRAEASAQHLAMDRQLAVLSEFITNINSRVGAMERSTIGQAS